MITIVTVAWNSYDFLTLLIESLEIFSSFPYELIVIDNSLEFQAVKAPHVHQFKMPNNIGHGRGLNHGVAKAHELFPRHPFIMFLDCDTHFISHKWEVPFLELMKKYDVVGGRGVPQKPIRPACMFMHRQFARYDWADTTGYKGHRVTPEGFDVAIKAYYQMLADRRQIGFLESGPNRYGTMNGEEWCIDGVPLVYHHWSGTHLKERQVDYPNVDLFEDKAKLFARIPWRLL